jgi:hypothetical protein
VRWPPCSRRSYGITDGRGLWTSPNPNAALVHLDVEDVARALRLFTSPEFRRRCKASSCIAGSYGRSAPVTIGGVRLSGDGAAGGPVQLPAGSRPTDGAAFGRIGSVGFPPPEVIRNL